MKAQAGWIKILVAVLCLQVGWALPVHAQQVGQQKPVMENVFFNVVWGSAAGAYLGVAAAVIASEDKSDPENVRPGAFQGATLGGIIGLGVGIWLVFSGITFDPNQSTIFQGPPQAGLAPDRNQPLVRSGGGLPPFSLETAPGDSLKITGFKAKVLDLKF